MKQIFLSLVLSCLAINSVAQYKVRSLSLEILGAQNAVGINYGSRLSGNYGWGYRVGLGYGYGFSDDQTINGMGIPLEMNYLVGKKRNHLELGVGVNGGIYHVEDTGWFTSQSSTQFGYFFFADIGYRYQRPKGFLFRAGFSPSFNFGDDYGLSKSLLYPYIGFGWCF